MAETKPLESRERFEAYEKRTKKVGDGYLSRRPDGTYRYWDAQHDYELWLAAEREALERAAQIVKEMAGEIGLHVAYHIEEMYPNAVKAAPKSFLLSVRNCTANKIAALGCDLGKG